MSKLQLRQSQVVTTFGPGAMVDMPDDSVIIAGLDHWDYEPGKIPLIEEKRLVAKLRLLLNAPTLTLRNPPLANDLNVGFKPGITGFRFPEWFLVIREIRTGPGRKRRRLVHWDSLEGYKYRDRDGKSFPVVPVRFVRACPKGHVGNIDWRAFVHGKENTCPRELWMEEWGTSGDLNDIWIVCDCGQRRSMAQAARRELRALGHCNGSRPWLGPGTREGCGELNRLLIRSASNAYFSQQLSVISIPDQQAGIDSLVSSLWDDGLSAVEAASELKFVRKMTNLAVKLAAYPDDDDLFASIERIRGGGDGSAGSVKEAEFIALSETKEELGSDVPEGDFFARALSPSCWSAPYTAGIERVVLVHRLREVVAQVGFTRFEAAAPDINGDLDLAVERAPLSINENWLPAAENRGEGIFMRFGDDAMDDWCGRPPVMERGRMLDRGFKRWKAEHPQSRREFAGLPYCMLHSLSHLLMVSISLECGYPASSLRERIYAMPGAYGILIYTGSPDAEGTLGGLAAAGRQISRHLRCALELGSLCSNDPICAYHSPAAQDDQTLLGSACHSCLLVSETSCEQRNDYMDRALVIPTIEACGAEFFTGVI